MEVDDLSCFSFNYPLASMVLTTLVLLLPSCLALEQTTICLFCLAAVWSLLILLAFRMVWQTAFTVYTLPPSSELDCWLHFLNMCLGVTGMLNITTDQLWSFLWSLIISLWLLWITKKFHLCNCFIKSISQSRLCCCSVLKI